MDKTYVLNIERAILSAILFDPSIIDDVSEVLEDKNFYLKNHQLIFKSMLELHNNNMPIDEEFIRKDFKDKSIIDRVLLDILAANPITNITAYLKEIKNEAVKRELSSYAIEIKQMVDDESLHTDQVIDNVQNKIYSISTNASTSILKDGKILAKEYMDHLEKIKKRGNLHVTGEITGFRELDHLTTGFNSGDLVIIAARPGMGKTSLLLNMLQKNLDAGKGVIIFSLEMPSDQLVQRLISAKTSIPLQDLKKADMTDQQWSDLSNSINELEQCKLFVEDGGSITINQLRSQVRKVASNPENNISMVMIDYLQLMQSGGNRDRHIEVSEMSRGLKMLARELNIPVIALSQLNRSLENRADKRPMLSDLRESGSIEQDADIIMFVYRDDVYRKSAEKQKESEAKLKNLPYKSSFIEKPEEDAELIIGKQRNGPTDTVNLIFQKQFTRFISAPQKHEPSIEVVFESSDPRETKVEMPPII
ncbi:MAG: replicative DNA helicase [Campylobacterota bacterium]|nr:replicative DNA helicase [Campylobacterota bacterium]